MTYDDLTRSELEAKVWANITTRIAIQSLMQPSFYRTAEEALDSEGKIVNDEALDEIADKQSKDLARAYFNIMESQGFLTWDEEGHPIIGDGLNLSKMSEDELRQVLEDIDAGKYDHHFSELTGT